MAQWRLARVSWWSSHQLHDVLSRSSLCHPHLHSFLIFLCHSHMLLPMQSITLPLCLHILFLSSNYRLNRIRCGADSTVKFSSATWNPTLFSPSHAVARTRSPAIAAPT